MIYYAIVLGLLFCLAAGVIGVYTFATGADRQRAIIARSVLNESERRANNTFVRLDGWLRRTDIGRWVERRLLGAGVQVRISVFLSLMIVSAALAIVLITELLSPVMGGLAAVGVGFSFFAYLSRKQNRRSEAFIGQLPELARVLSNAAAAGLAIRVAIGMAAEEMSEPASTELRRTADALAFGKSFENALTELRDRLPSRELAVLVSTLMISTRSGGAVVTALRNISTTLEERKETRREVKTIMGEAVVTAWGVIVMAIGTMLLMNAIEPGAVARMTSSPIGLIVLGIVIVLCSAAVLIIRRITRIDI
ncbi:MAG TPA: type II secretion system F family protein [Streptosporangiaceae bacterium]